MNSKTCHFRISCQLQGHPSNSLPAALAGGLAAWLGLGRLPVHQSAGGAGVTGGFRNPHSTGWVPFGFLSRFFTPKMKNTWENVWQTWFSNGRATNCHPAWGASGSWPIWSSLDGKWIDFWGFEQNDPKKCSTTLRAQRNWHGKSWKPVEIIPRCESLICIQILWPKHDTFHHAGGGAECLWHCSASGLHALGTWGGLDGWRVPNFAVIIEMQLPPPKKKHNTDLTGTGRDL